jgi:histidinol dehydrogenase
VARRPGNAKKPFLNIVNQQEAEAKAKQLESQKKATEAQDEKVALKRLRIAEVWDLRRDVVDKKTREIVEEILTDVREKGEEALIRQSVRLGTLLRPHESSSARYLAHLSRSRR